MKTHRSINYNMRPQTQSHSYVTRHT